MPPHNYPSLHTEKEPRSIIFHFQNKITGSDVLYGQDGRTSMSISPITMNPNEQILWIFFVQNMLKYALDIFKYAQIFLIKWTWSLLDRQYGDRPLRTHVHYDNHGSCCEYCNSCSDFSSHPWGGVLNHERTLIHTCFPAP
jgi:hypothetical protein